MKKVDIEIEKHRLDRDYSGALALCDMLLENRRNKAAVQRRLDIICASINSSDRRDALADAIGTVAQGCKNIRFNLDGRTAHLFVNVPQDTGNSPAKKIGVTVAVVSLAVSAVLLCFSGVLNV